MKNYLKLFFGSLLLLMLVVLFAGITSSCNNANVKPSTEELDNEEEEQEEEEEEEEENAVYGSPVERYGQLRIEGNKMVGKDGKPVQLRGMSFFWSQWLDGSKFYHSETVHWLTEDWRCTIVRAAMAVEHGGYLTSPDLQKQRVETIVDAAIEAGIYVIIDYHSHKAHENQEAAVTFFGEMAKKYGDYPNVIYEIYNEPEQVSWSAVVKPYSEAVIAAIREHDPDNIIVCGTPFWCQNVDEAANDPVEGDNIAYSLHFYAASHKQGIRNKAKSALEKGVAVFVTEYGTAEHTGDGFLDEQETKIWWKFMDDNHISWCNWSITDKNEKTAALKQGANVKGNWPDSQISQSGLLVRSELKKHNPAPKGTKTVKYKK